MVKEYSLEKLAKRFLAYLITHHLTREQEENLMDDWELTKNGEMSIEEFRGKLNG